MLHVITFDQPHYLLPIIGGSPTLQALKRFASYNYLLATRVKNELKSCTLPCRYNYAAVIVNSADPSILNYSLTQEMHNTY